MHIAAVTSLVDFNLLYTLLLYAAGTADTADTADTAITSLIKQPYFIEHTLHFRDMQSSHILLNTPSISMICKFP